MKAFYDQQPDKVYHDNDGTTVYRCNIESFENEDGVTQWQCDEVRTVGALRLKSLYLRLSLINAGISFGTIDTIINSLPEPIKSIAKTKWEFAEHFDRDDALLQQIAMALEITEEKLDEIFITGNGI